MINRKKIAHHFVVHIHEDGKQHRAHLVSEVGLYFCFQILVIFTSCLFLTKTLAPHILGVASYNASQIIELTNAERKSQGLPALKFNATLAKAAQEKAEDMFADDYWAHNSPAGKTPWFFITSSGYRYIFAGENLARDFSDPVSVVDAWMDSPSHRSNLLDDNFRDIGVAVATGDLAGGEVVLVVQMFGAQSTSYLAQDTSGARTQQEQEREPSQNPQFLAQGQEIEQGDFGTGAQITVLASRKTDIAKGVALSMVGLIFVLFAVEVLVTLRHEHLKLKSNVFAHLLFLGFVLLAVWYFQAGAIL